ncbi:MAG: peptidylprolyl isomerase [Acidobacteria bacterium]|nr:peptidylprolyl isomerase [Acidobacteriota bacterium]
MRFRMAVWLWLGACAVAPGDEVKVVEQIVAKINNEIITQGELERTHRQVEAELKRQGVSGERLQQALKEAEKDLLRDRIDHLLLVQRGKDLNVNVDGEVSKYLADLQLQFKISDPDQFQQFVREQTGMPYEDFRQQTRDGIVTRRVIQQEVGSKISIPRTEVRKYYDEHKNEFVREEQVFLREIFVSTEGKDAAGVAAAEKKAKDLVERARKKENFATMARDNSDAATAQSLGELGAFKRGELRKEIEDLVFKQERGYVTDPLRQPNGFLILRVEERYEAGLQPFEAVENEVMERLYTPRMQPAVRTYLTRLRQDAFLEIRAGFLDSGAAPGKDTAWRDPAKFTPQTVTKEEVAAMPRQRRLLWLVPIPSGTGGVTVQSPGP